MFPNIKTQTLNLNLSPIKTLESTISNFFQTKRKRQLSENQTLTNVFTLKVPTNINPKLQKSVQRFNFLYEKLIKIFQTQALASFLDILTDVQNVFSTIISDFNYVNIEKEGFFSELVELKKTRQSLSSPKIMKESSCTTFKKSNFQTSLKNIEKDSNPSSPLSKMNSSSPKNHFSENLVRNETLKKNMIAQEKELNIANFENIKLKSEISSLWQKLNFYENFDVGPLIKELEATKLKCTEEVGRLNKEMNELKNVIEEYKLNSHSYKTNISKMEKEVKKWINLSGENQRKADSYEKENINLKQMNNQFREIIGMKNEEYIALAIKYDDNLKSINSLQEKINLYKKKLDSYSSKSNTQDFLMEKDFKKELFSITSLENSLSLEYSFQNNLKFNFLQKPDPFEPNLRKIRAENDLSKFQFVRANFFQLIEHRYQIVESEYTLNFNKSKIPIHPLRIVRAIFDSKFNEYMFFSDSRLFTRFPEFVYEWLGNYEVELDLGKIIKKEDNYRNNVAADDERILLLLELTHTKLNKLWECQIFLEFLTEKLAKDELFFFLHCRALLFKGPQLDYLESRFNFIHFIKYEQVEDVVNTLLAKHEESVRNIIFNRILETAKKKKNNLFVDSAFVLRILLEFYKQEKALKFGLIRDAFQQLALNFENIKKIIKYNWRQISEAEIVEIYRDVWGLSQGRFSLEAFLTYLNEGYFFIKTLKLAMSKGLPLVFEPDTSNIKNGAINEDECNYFIKNSEFINNFENKLNPIYSLGMNAAEIQIKKIYKIIENKFQIQSEDFKNINMYSFLLKSMEVILNLYNPFFKTKVLREQNKEIEIMNEIKLFEAFEMFDKIFLKEDQETKLLKLRMNIKLRVFQKFAKKKIAKWNAEFAAVLKKKRDLKI